MGGAYFFILIDICCSVILTLLNLLLPSKANASSAVKQNSALYSKRAWGLLDYKSLYSSKNFFNSSSLHTPLSSTY
jgi:hypothetical protein